mmetsp:Transcript_47996/g.72609  ORF Transcript_47996/g.72609 Transcript_47996/m.72609 type:complete len:304 (+) Transcript_47996:955-1866(+)
MVLLLFIHFFCFVVTCYHHLPLKLPKAKVKLSFHAKKRNILKTILRANLAMFTKQGSLLVGWAYATRRAAQLGPDHVAAHQVALSSWLVFALIMDGVAVAAQVIMSTTWSLFVRSRDDDEMLNQEGEKKEGVMQDALEEKNDSSSSPSRCEVRSLTHYMTNASLLQGLLSTLILLYLSNIVPFLTTNDISVQKHLLQILPHVSRQQILVSLTLVWESLVIGGGYFTLLACGTLSSSLLAVWKIGLAGSIEEIWSGGIVVLFLGRLVTAFVGVLDMYFGLFDFMKGGSNRNGLNGKGAEKSKKI